MAGKSSRMGEVFGTDHEVVARFVDIWRNPVKVGRAPFKEGEPRTPVFVNDIAWELGLGAAKVAITFKYAEKQGWVRRTNARTEQAAYEPTEKALAQYPEGEAQVMPEPPKAKLASGAEVSGVSAKEARSWDDDPGLAKLGDRPQQEGLPGPKENFKGYLEKGDTE